MRYRTLPEVAAKYALGLGLSEQTPLADWENGLKTMLEAKKRGLQTVKNPSLAHKAERECAEIEDAVRLVAQLNLFGKLRRCIQDDKQETFEWELKKPEGLAALPNEQDPLYGDYLDIKGAAKKKWPGVAFAAPKAAAAASVPPAAPGSPVVPAPAPAAPVPPVAAPPSQAPVSPEVKPAQPAGAGLAAPPPAPPEPEPQAPAAEIKAPEPSAPPKDATIPAVQAAVLPTPPQIRREPAAAAPPSAAPATKPLSPQPNAQVSSPPAPAQPASADQAFQPSLNRAGLLNLFASSTAKKVLVGALAGLLVVAAGALISRYRQNHQKQLASLSSETPGNVAPQPTSHSPEPEPARTAPALANPTPVESAPAKPAPAPETKPTPPPPAPSTVTPVQPIPPVEQKPVFIPPKPAHLVVDSFPHGATISLDGQRQPTHTPAEFTLSPGTYNVGVVVEGYFATNATVSLSPDQQITLTFLDPSKRDAGSASPAATTVGLIQHPPKEVNSPAPPPARESPAVAVTPPPTVVPSAPKLDPAQATALAVIKIGNQHVRDQAKDRVIEIRSRKERGNIPPAEWDILYDDRKEFGLTRFAADVHIRNGQYEGTGQQGISGPAGIGVRKPMPLERVKIDSDRALEITRTSLGSDVPLIMGDFCLHAGQGDLPTWTIKLWASKPRDPRALVDLGSIEISAEDGSILKNALRSNRVR